MTTRLVGMVHGVAKVMTINLGATITTTIRETLNGGKILIDRINNISVNISFNLARGFNHKENAIEAPIAKEAVKEVDNIQIVVWEEIVARV